MAVISLELMFELWKNQDLPERVGKLGLLFEEHLVEGNVTKQPKNWEKTKTVLTTYINEVHGEQQY